MVIGYRKIYPLRRGMGKKTGYRRTPNCLQVKENAMLMQPAPLQCTTPSRNSCKVAESGNLRGGTRPKVEGSELLTLC